MTSHHLCFAVLASVLLGTPAWANDAIPTPISPRAWSHVSFGNSGSAESPARPLVRFDPVALVAAEPAQRPVAVTHSDAYNVRLKIHRYASYPTMPLFVAQYFIGQKLYDGSGGESAKSAHGALVAGMTGLFAVNTVTGVWNLLESRKEPNSTKRWIHGLMMLGAGAGFVATGASAPDDDDGGGANRSRHRNLAIGSMGVSAASYLYMFFTR